MRLSLKQRTVLTVGGLTAMLLTAALSLDLYREYQDRSDSLHKRGDFLAGFLSKTLAKPLLHNDSETIHNTLSITSSNPDFLGAVVRNQHGEEIHIGAHPFSTIEQLLFHRTIFYPPDADGNDAPPAEPQQIGSLTLLFSTQKLNLFLYDQIFSKGVFAVALVLLTLLVLYLGTLSVTRPLRRLIDAMQQFSRGEYRQEVYGLHRSDEVAEMAIALEVLRHNLQERDEIKHTLEMSNINLEQRVLERTQALTQEVEDRKQAEHRAKAADLAKSRFLANMSHEIRTPMNAVIGFTHLALMDNPSPQQQEYLNKINNASQSLLDIINDILDLSKIEAGQLDIEKIPFDLNELLDQIADVTVFKAAEKQVEVIFDIDPLLPVKLIGDPTRLRQILINLTGNAIKFTEQGEIILRVWGHFSTGNNELHFSVKDSGIGLSEEQMGRLFQTFSQADSSTSRKYGGTGLGLSISKQLTEIMGGAIEVNSLPNQGAQFHFYIRAELQQQSSPPIRTPLGNHSILIVDDHPVALRKLEEMLTHLGASVDACTSGAEAIEHAQQHAAEGSPYTLALIDWDMPHQDGTEVAHQLQQAQIIPISEIILMVTTGYRQQALQQCNPVLQDSLRWLDKPVTPYHLLQTIENRHTTSPANQHTYDPAVILDLSGTRILLVEDNPLNQQVAGEILRHAHIAVDIANNGREALEQLKQHSGYSLILMDLQMPEMDGFEATQEIRKQFSSEELPVIAMTANAMATDRIQAEEAGIDDFLFKPIDVEKLYRTIEQWCTTGPHVTRTFSSAATSCYNWPTNLPGLDIEAGLARTVGNQQAYLDILRSFTDQLPSLFQDIIDAINQENSTHIQRSIHTIKGVAANLSANLLVQTSTELEQSIITHGKPTASLLGQLKRDMDQVTESIKQLERLSTTKNELNTSPLSLSSGGAFELTLQQLLRQLEENNPDVISLFEQLKPILEAEFDPAHIQELSESIQNFNFSNARKLFSLLDMEKITH